MPFLVLGPNAFSTSIGLLFLSLIVTGLPSFFKNPLNALRLKKVSTWLFIVEYAGKPTFENLTSEAI